MRAWQTTREGYTSLFGVDVISRDSQAIGFDGGSSASLEDDFGLAVTFGYRFNDKLELQFAIDWQDIDCNLLIQSAPPTVPVQQFWNLDLRLIVFRAGVWQPTCESEVDSYLTV